MMAEQPLLDSHELMLVSDVAELRALVGSPSDTVRRKQLAALDDHAKKFIAFSPFALLATSAKDGSCDVSPRGDGPGFALVLNHRQIVMPDRPGNRRNDSLLNLLENPGLGLLFMVPGVEETLRVNGHGRLVRGAPWFDRLVAQSKRPTLAILVDIDEVFFHCPKAFRRSRLWQQETWPDRSVLPSLGQILKDQVRLAQSIEEIDSDLEESYVRTLY